MSAVAEHLISRNGIAPGARTVDKNNRHQQTAIVQAHQRTGFTGTREGWRVIVGDPTVICNVARNAANIIVNQRYYWNGWGDAIDNNFPTGGAAGVVGSVCCRHRKYVRALA